MNISNDDLRSSLKEFIASTSFSDISKLKDDTFIFREGFFDSMGFMSLITYLEQNYNIKVLDNELIEDNFESVNAIVSFAKRKEAIS